MKNATASIITCDLEGRIQSFNDGAQALFGYAPEEMIGRERVSVFSDGLTVLGHIPRWLAAAVRDGAFETDTAFRRKDGTLFAARIRITPTRRGGAHVGYCGVTCPLPGVDPRAVLPPPTLAARAMRWLVVTRAPFLTATVVPVLLGTALAWRETGAFDGPVFALALAAAMLLHLGTNMANDYFDWKSGTDDANLEYVVPFSGGSRSIQLGLIEPASLLRLAVAAFGLAGAAGAGLVALRGLPVAGLGAAGLFLGWFYTAPPLRLAARKGLGEAAVFLGFGPLMVAGAHFVQSGALSWTAAWAGVPVGLLVAAILYINEFPDHDGDKATGKNHLVVVLGKERGIRLYAAMMAAAYAFIVGGALLGLYPKAALVAAAGGLLAWSAVRTALRHYADRGLTPAQAKTIQAHLVTGLLFAAAHLLR